MGLVLITPPASEPVTLAVAKVHCKVEADQTADDSLLTTFIAASRRQVESYAGIGVVTQVWQHTLDRFPAVRGCIDLPRGPVQSIASITYLDAVGGVTTLSPSAYVLDSTETSDRVSLVFGQVWPPCRRQANAITIQFTIGFADDAVPENLVAAILLRTGDLYRNREAQTASKLEENVTACALLDDFVRTSIV